MWLGGGWAEGSDVAAFPAEPQWLVPETLSPCGSRTPPTVLTARGVEPRTSEPSRLHTYRGCDPLRSTGMNEAYTLRGHGFAKRSQMTGFMPAMCACVKALVFPRRQAACTLQPSPMPKQSGNTCIFIQPQR